MTINTEDPSNKPDLAYLTASVTKDPVTYDPFITINSGSGDLWGSVDGSEWNIKMSQFVIGLTMSGLWAFIASSGEESLIVWGTSTSSSTNLYVFHNLTLFASQALPFTIVKAIYDPDNRLIVVIGESGQISVSKDGGTTFNQVFTPTNTIQLCDVTYGNGLYLAVGDNTGDNDALFVNSMDGSNWFEQDGVAGIIWNSIAYNPDHNKFVAVGGNTSSQLVEGIASIVFTLNQAN
jgi:hypothetical protein